MTIKLDLSLEDMLRIAGWNAGEFNDYKEDFTLTPTKYKLPYRLTMSKRLASVDDVESTATRFGDYHRDFMRVHGIKFIDAIRISNSYIIQFYSEGLSNITEHGGGRIKKKDTLIQVYHPVSPHTFVLRFSNPSAISWDFSRILAKGRGGRSTFDEEHALVSYENEGRDFIALLKPPLDKSDII